MLSETSLQFINPCPHSYIYTGLLANRLTPWRRGSISFIHISRLPDRRRTRKNIAHHQVNILLVVKDLLSFITLLKGRWCYAGG